MGSDRRLWRVLDANFNRSREGLRVCEEIFRFFLDDAVMTRRLKKARHQVTRLMKAGPVPISELLASRNVGGDEGKKPSRLEKRRTDAADLFGANIERVKESLRAIEEFTKLADAKLSDRYKKLRFEVYAIEKQAHPKLEALRRHGSGGR